MDGVHNVWKGLLCQVLVELARDGSVVKNKCKSWFVLVSNQYDVCLCRHWFGNGSPYARILNDGVDECSLSELNATSIQTFDVNSHIVGWVTLVLNVKFQALK